MRWAVACSLLWVESLKLASEHKRHHTVTEVGALGWGLPCTGCWDMLPATARAAVRYSHHWAHTTCTA
jgi:hypothetical protein